MDTPSRLAQETSIVCEELDYELITDDPDWQDWRFEDEGTVKTVSINLEENCVTVEITYPGEEPEVFEYSGDEDATARKVKRKL